MLDFQTVRARFVAVLGVSLAVTAITSTAYADVLSDLEAPFRSALSSGHLGVALGLVFLAGLATSLTPCVYPMIAITVSIFGARQVKSRQEGALLSTAFVLGIAALFTPLGIAAALTGGVFGSALANPWVLAALALIFIAFALSMFGVFELNLPPALHNRLAGIGGAGYKGAFALGLVSAIVAAPCTGPVLAVLLTWVGTSGNVGFGALSLFVYAIGLGMLFWIVGTFAVSLPKSGRWLESVKSVFGIVMLVMALFYLRGVLPMPHVAERSTELLVAAVVLFGVGLVLGAVHLSYYDATTITRLRKTAGIALSVVGILGAITWLEALPKGAKIAWLENYEAARQLAREQARPMLVDFGASWCGACGELDRNTFSDARVVKETRDLVSVRVDLSPGKDTPENRAALASYNQRGLPLVVLHDREGREVARVTEFVEPEEMLEILQAVR